MEKISSIELEQRILAELEESLGENLHAILNTILVPSVNEDQVVQLATALRRLVEGNLVEIGMEARGQHREIVFDRQASLQFLDALAIWFLFDLERGSWTLATGDKRKDPCPAAFLTKAGELKAREVLQLRGYKWWKSRSK
jgi:hypothetical protein